MQDANFIKSQTKFFFQETEICINLITYNSRRGFGKLDIQRRES